jgi:hypothetical protein
VGLDVATGVGAGAATGAGSGSSGGGAGVKAVIASVAAETFAVLMSALIVAGPELWVSGFTWTPVNVITSPGSQLARIATVIVVGEAIVPTASPVGPPPHAYPIVGAAPPANVHPASRTSVTPVTPSPAPAVISTTPQVTVIGVSVVNAFVPEATFVFSETVVWRLLLSATACVVPAGPANSSAMAAPNDTTIAAPREARTLISS